MTLAVFLTILCLGVASAAPALDPSLDAEWQEWKMRYEKSYSSLVGKLEIVQKKKTQDELTLLLTVSRHIRGHRPHPSLKNYRITILVSTGWPNSLFLHMCRVCDCCVCSSRSLTSVHLQQQVHLVRFFQSLVIEKWH